MKLKNKKKLIEVFKDSRVNLVLHGHTHESGEYRYKGLRFSAAGGTIDGNKTGEIKINLIDIDDNKIEIDTRILSVPKKIPVNTYRNKKAVKATPLYNESSSNV